MVDKKGPMSGGHHHVKYVKQQQRFRRLVSEMVQLIEENDHDSLAFLARNCGVPPQLRHVVWPILLKYHPMCISPNITSNVVTWDSSTHTYRLVEGKKAGRGDRSPEDLEALIVHDLRKYLHSRNNGTGNGYATTSSSEVSTICSMDTSVLTAEDELEVVEALKQAVLRFLDKWGRVFKYESGLAWIASGLAEWVPVAEGGLDDGPVVLNGKKHTHSHAPPYTHTSGSSSLSATPTIAAAANNLCVSYLYKEYPLPRELRRRLPKVPPFAFDQTFERLALVILHTPDSVLAQRQLVFQSNSKESLSNYFPIISGGDLSFQTQVFFRVFSSILPELYQPFTEESVLQSSNKRSSWLYWWAKCSGARALQRQDRARLWDILLGWRPKPNMNCINFYLNYNTKKFDHLYKMPSSKHLEYLTSVARSDPFWFPDLDSIPLGTTKYKFDYEVLKKILLNNRQGDHPEEQSQTDEGCDGIPYSLIDPHLQLVFVYVAILQYSESKLLEFEETEISEYLNNVPMLSRADDVCYRRLYEVESLFESSTGSGSQEDLHKRPGSSNMLIEMGNDAKASHSFDDLLNMAGDIWRKWLWNELEDSSLDE